MGAAHATRLYFYITILWTQPMLQNYFYFHYLLYLLQEASIY